MAVSLLVAPSLLSLPASPTFSDVPANAFPSLIGPAQAASVSPPAEDPQLPREDALRMISFSFDVIADRHLDPLTGRTLALESLQGLGTLDPSLTVTIDDRWVQLSNAQGIVASYATPSDTDLSGWSRVTVDTILAARRASGPVSRSGAEEIYQVLFDALLSHLDPYSRYAGRIEAAENRASRNGFGGIGIRYRIVDNTLALSEIVPDTPAEDAGLKPGDSITAINGVPIATLNGEEEAVRARLRGPLNSQIRLTYIRGTSAPQELSLRRGLVVPQTVTLVSRSDGIAQIRISSFNHRTARNLEQVITAAAAERPLTGLILDLRGNPGGLLDQAVSAADLFMDHGRIVTTRGRHPEAMQSYSAQEDDIARGLPIVVLMDGKSASAAEILAAALQDSGRAVVAGTSSYGKGSVQTVVRLPNDGEMTLTWSRFHSPAGYALQGLGVMPSLCIYDQQMTPSLSVDTLAHSTAALRSLNAQWHSVALADTSGRSALRDRCPATSHADWPVDVDVGRSLLRNQAAYAGALAVQVPPQDTAALRP